MKKILILSSNPRNDLKLEREIKDLKNVIKRSKNRTEFEIEFELEVHPEELQELLLENEPRIVHFCGHGTGKEGLVLQNNAGREQVVSTEALSNLFELFDKQVECVLLNACYSEVQADATVQYINYVIGMSQEIRDDEAIAFATGFYRALGWGKSIEESYKFGCNAIQIQIPKANTSRSRNAEASRHVAEPVIIPEDLKPVLKKKSPLTPFPEEVTSAPSQSEFPPELIEAVQEEANYKGYRVQVRENWDEFGQANVARQPLSQHEYRQRQTLLKKVKEFWIEGFLKPSLYASTPINLEWKTNSDAVFRPFEGIKEIPVELDESFEELQATDILNEAGFGKTMLILGDPGSGKTITLLQLAEKLVNQTEQDLTKPIPVVFNLSSWGGKHQPIEKWLIEEFKDKYQVPKTWSEYWLEKQQLVLLLDGLDEVRAEQRNACVRALNKFIATHNITEMVVCSRVKDYEALTERLQLSSAICIKPLSQKQVYSFLNKVGDLLAGLRTLLQQDRELEKFAQTPLILNVMSWAYQGLSAEDLLQQFRSNKDHYQHLFDSYIERMLHRRVIGQLGQNPNSAKYAQEKVKHWLSWLAKTMVNESKIIFLIEKMQPTLLESRRERNCYRIRNFLLGWLILGLSSGLSFGLNFRLNFKLSVGLSVGLIGGVIAVFSKEIILFEQISWSYQRAKSRIIREIILGLIYGLISGLSFGLSFGLIYGLISGLIRNLSYGLIYALISWLSYGLTSWLSFGLSFWLSFGLIGGLIGGLKSGLSSTEVKQRTFPNQGIWSSRKNFVRVGLIFGLIGGLIFGLTYGLISGLTYGLSVGLIGGLLNGGTTCIQHFNLRRILFCKGRIPWNYARFLDYASERLLMKKVGGGYVFYHRMLMEHFAGIKQ